APGAQTNGVGPGTTGGTGLPQGAAEANHENPAPQTTSSADIAQSLDVPEQFLTGTLTDNLVWLFDQVKDPGPYLAAQGTSLGELVQLAGGPLRTADLTAVEVTSTTIDAVSGTSRTIRTEYKGTIEDFKKVPVEVLEVIRF